MAGRVFFTTASAGGHLVKAEVGKISGVTAVDVDLVTGKVTVTANEPVGEALVRDAVEEAGYELTSA